MTIERYVSESNREDLFMFSEDLHRIALERAQCMPSHPGLEALDVNLAEQYVALDQRRADALYGPAGSRQHVLTIIDELNDPKSLAYSQRQGLPQHIIH